MHVNVHLWQSPSGMKCSLRKHVPFFPQRFITFKLRNTYKLRTNRYSTIIKAYLSEFGSIVRLTHRIQFAGRSEAKSSNEGMLGEKHAFAPYIKAYLLCHDEPHDGLDKHHSSQCIVSPKRTPK